MTAPPHPPTFPPSRPPILPPSRPPPSSGSSAIPTLPRPPPPPVWAQVLSDPKEWRNRLVNTKSHHAKAPLPATRLAGPSAPPREPGWRRMGGSRRLRTPERSLLTARRRRPLLQEPALGGVLARLLELPLWRL